MRGDNLIFYLVDLRSPQFESPDGFFAKQYFRRQLAGRGWQSQFVVDERIVEIDALGIQLVVGIVNLVQTGPIDGSQAHGAGFTGCVDFASAQVESAQLGSGCSDGADFGMGGWVALGGYLVHAGGDDFAVAGDDGSEGTAPIGYVVNGKFDGFSHQFFFGHKAGCF